MAHASCVRHERAVPPNPHCSGRPAQFQGIMVCVPDSLRGALGACDGAPAEFQKRSASKYEETGEQYLR